MKRTLVAIAALLLAWVAGTFIHAWRIMQKGVVIYAKPE